MTPQDLNNQENWWIKESRTNFLAFRRFTRPLNFECNWFVENLAARLQAFLLAMIRGEAPILIISTPPQHGKSITVSDFIAWTIGSLTSLYPEFRTIYASYSDHLGVRCNLFLQKLISSEKYQKIFPHVAISKYQKITQNNLTQRNRNIFEFEDGNGYFRNTTVGGPVNGESLDFGVLDDAYKGRERANSPDHRQKVREWFSDDFFGRFSKKAGLLFINTRWHIDDLPASLDDALPGVKMVNYKAIADKDEKYRKAGEPLFPAIKPLDFLLKRKRLMEKFGKPENWLSVWQGEPVIAGGNQFKIDHFRWWTTLPPIKYKFIVADTAQKKGVKNDFTDFQLWGYGVDGNIYLLDHVHKKMEAPELRKRALKFWNRHNTPRIEIKDPILRKMHIELKVSGIGLIQELRLKKVRVAGMERNTDKEFRADDVIPYIEEGRVYLNKDIKDIDVITTETAQFPNGVHDDAIDNLMNAVEVTYINKDSADDLRAAMEA